jgi:GPN-loop GTPase
LIALVSHLALSLAMNLNLIKNLQGQIELYTHIPVLPSLVRLLSGPRFDFRVCKVHLQESQFVQDSSKFFSGILSAMSSMIAMEVPTVNLMSKMDLVKTKKSEGRRVSRIVFRVLSK